MTQPRDVLIVTAANGAAATGNHCTAQQWADILRGLGHRATVAAAYDGQEADVLVALHGVKSRAAVAAFRAARPGARVVVALTGTDVYPKPAPETIESVRGADRVVALQDRVPAMLPPDVRDRVRVIVQSATAHPPGEIDGGVFDAGVVAHLRAVKDPLRAAAAARMLPPDSRVRIRHAGAILEPGYRDLVARERRENPRYTWLGELSPAGARSLMAACAVVVVSAPHEGGARVIGESLVAGTPVLAARNDAGRSLLGDDYAGFFDAGNTEALGALLRRAETDGAFLARLRERARARAHQFDPRREVEAWRGLMAELA